MASASDYKLTILTVEPLYNRHQYYGMPEYIRWVSVYTGPGLYANLKDEYEAAVLHIAGASLPVSNNVVVYNDEDLGPEDGYIRNVQLFSHLLIKVTVYEKDLLRNHILLAAALTLQKLYLWEHDVEPRYFTARKLIHEPETYIMKLEPGHHPIFTRVGVLLSQLQPRQWTPEDVEQQYSEYPKACAEDRRSREARRQREKASAAITFCRSEFGKVEVVAQEGNKAVRAFPWRQKAELEPGEVNY